MFRWRRFLFAVTVAFALMPSLTAMAQADIPQVSVHSEMEGWYDLEFAILARAPAMDGDTKWGTLLKIGGVLNGQLVEWGLALPDEWEEAKMTPPPPMKSWAGLVLFGRVGPTSDSLIRALARIYQFPESELSARDEVGLDAVSIFDDPRPIGVKPIHLKVFVHGEKEDYAEFYLNVDLRTGTVKLKEKDPEYRGAILRAFAKREQ